MATEEKTTENSSTSVDESLIGDLTISTDEEITVGIELGGSYSSIGIWHLMEGRYELIHKCRTSVSFDDGVELVGEPSLETVTENTVLDVTSFLGRNSSDMIDKDYISYKMVEGPLVRPVVPVTRNGHSYTFCSEELYSFILKKLKMMGENHLRRSVNRVVLCVPTSFGTLQRQATLDAAAIAGLEVVSLIDESTSIGVAFYTLKNPTSQTKIIIGHMGFFGFDLSLIEYTRDGRMKVLVKSTDESLGLHKYISRVMKFFIDNMDHTPTVEELMKLRIESERVILRLSSSPSTKIDIDDNISLVLTREVFRGLYIDLIEKTKNHVCDFFYKVIFRLDSIGKCDAVLSGATLTIPDIGEQLKRSYLNHTNIDVSDFITRGAAIHASYYHGPKGFWSFEVVDVTHQAISCDLKGAIYQKKLSLSIPKGAGLPVKDNCPLMFQSNENPCAFILTLHEDEGEKHLESRYSFILGEGFQSINICLEMDRNGILKVYAEDKGRTIASAMANHKALSTDDILLFKEKAKRLDARDLELPAAAITEEYPARYTDLHTSNTSDPDGFLIERSKMDKGGFSSIQSMGSMGSLDSGFGNDSGITTGNSFGSCSGFGLTFDVDSFSSKSKGHPSAAVSAPSKGMGMKLGKSQKANQFMESLKAEGEVIVEDVRPSANSSRSAAPPPTDPITLTTEEKLNVTLERDGGVINFDVRGTLYLQVLNQYDGFIQVQIESGDNPEINFKTHPNINKQLFNNASILGSKDPNRPFPAGQSGDGLGLLKWRLQYFHELDVPLAINCRPSVSGNETYVSIQYEAQLMLDLQNVVISVPLPALREAPTVKQIDGEWRYDSRNSILEWSLPIIDDSNRTGSMEFVVPPADTSAFFPISVRFSATSTFSNMKVVSIVPLKGGTAPKFAHRTQLVTKSYQVV